jgi:MATE family multidrug resistance protein
MMIVSLAIFLAAYALLTPAFGNDGLWASLLIFYVVRAATLALRYPMLEKASFGKERLGAYPADSH